MLVVRGAWPAIFAGVVGTLGVALVFGRWRGRWWTETATLWLRYRRNRAGEPATAHAATAGPAAIPGPADPDSGTDPRLAALGALVSDLAVESVPGTDAWPRWGMGSDGAGWFAVLEVDTTDAGVHPPLPLWALAEIATEAEQPGAVIQIVTHTSNQGGDVTRTLWVVVRLDSVAVADSVVDGAAQQPDVPAVLAELSRRVTRVLRRRRLRARAVDRDGLLAALLRSCALTPDGPAGFERWRWWSSGRLAHRSFWLRSWPTPEAGTTILAYLSDLPAAGRRPGAEPPDPAATTEVNVALTLEPRDGDGVDLRALVRLAATPERLATLSDRAEALAEQLGAGLFPLDGEQALAVYGSAPTGGGAR
ncbi:hypothetical protein JQS43_02825 [Natronosporangium hydrolyticum]|uniref:Type VII secretion system protein EccE domain-containing protein n=1 Tax=Natronosporangium hydrolyticum TaxID=2811111 RepID=A0A895YBW8_9ACTN|nr:type VII secretion protein EccE [Natronosporangium hydrolyticum]QSB15314.1 hypothetical protein JQS43_02825 [Natronosporangium hydrolyticum]